MCTAISDSGARHIFGRTLDLEFSLGERVVITPRRFRFNFLHLPSPAEHYAIIGAAHIADGVPLYYDAANERGLCAAALNFPGFAEYHSVKRWLHNAASFELIPWVLSRAESVEQVRRLLVNSNITDDSFSQELSATPLHWIFADRHSAIAVESTRTGLEIHDNPEGVLTNSPVFSYHTINLEHYTHIMNEPTLPSRTVHSRGLSAFGLPGDFSSSSRFIKAAYVKSHTEPPMSKTEAVSRFFHLMDTVSQPRGITRSAEDAPVRTVYISAIDTESLEYFFTTYENRRVRCVKLDTATAIGENLRAIPMHSEEDVLQLD